MEFKGVVTNGVTDFGLSGEIAMAIYPTEMFNSTDSDLSPIREGTGKIINGLTQWKPTIKKRGLIERARVTVEGKDDGEVIDPMNHLFLRNRWGDGLPLLPPTEERVSRILRGTDLSPDTVIGKILPRGGITTVETAAIALAMAGGRPEYLSVLIASIKALVDPKLGHQRWQATSASTFPVVIVNGPIASQIRLNSGFGLMGPDPAHPAGGSIGRTFRLLQQNVGGALPGVGTMAQYGASYRYTNAVFAEDEAGLPTGWEPFNVEYLGYPRGTNSVAVYPAAGAHNMMTGKRLHQMARFIGVAYKNQIQGPYEEGAPGILVMSSVIAHQLADEGWTKANIKKFLWENTKVPMSVLEKTGMMKHFKVLGYEKTLQDPWPITSKPENFILVVAGGHHPTHTFWMEVCGGPQKVASAKIELPANWDSLIKQAEEDLGPTAGG